VNNEICGDIIADYVSYLHSDLKVSTYDETIILETPFTLPDGTVVQVAIEPDPKGEVGYVLLSDYGTVADFFMHHGQELSEEEQLIAKIADRAAAYGVVVLNEVLEVRTASRYISENVNELAQAAIAAAALWEPAEVTVREPWFVDRVRDVVTHIQLGLEEGFSVEGKHEEHEFDFGGRHNGRFVSLSLLSATQPRQARDRKKAICWDITDTTVDGTDIVHAVIVDDTTEERAEMVGQAGLLPLFELANTHFWSDIEDSEWQLLRQYRVRS